MNSKHMENVQVHKLELNFIYINTLMTSLLCVFLKYCVRKGVALAAIFSLRFALEIRDNLKRQN